MAGSYHVFIERPSEGGADAVARLAEAMAAQYGMPAATLRERLAAGRLRVKANVDRATADRFVAQLERLGAVCAVVDAESGAPAPAPAASAPPARPSGTALDAAAAGARPKPVAPTGLAAAGLARAPTPPPATPAPSPTAPAPPTASAFSSGLSAAFSPASASASQDLGALGSGELSLATLDGKGDGDDAPLASFAPPDADAALPASFGPAAPPPEADAAAAAAAPIDPFAPPDAAAEEALEVAVDVDELRQRRTAAATPMPATLAPEPAAAAAPDDARAAAHPGGGLARWVADRRARLAAGVVLAILLGFLPAHVVASVREGSAYAEIDDDVRRAYGRVVTEQDWHALDAERARQLARKRDKRRDIAIASLAIWAVVGGGVAFAWFRVVDWDRVAARLA